MKMRIEHTNKLFRILLITCGVIFSVVFIVLCLILSMAAFAG